jgi:hypothetical protein
MSSKARVISRSVQKKGPLIYDGPWETLGMVLLAFLKDKQARL